jgi:hypothetical protein
MGFTALYDILQIQLLAVPIRRLSAAPFPQALT